MATWEIESRRILKAELARAGVGYKVLSTRLAALGVNESDKNISNKISRGKFSFVFFLQCMKAIGVTEISAEADVAPPSEQVKRGQPNPNLP